MIRKRRGNGRRSKVADHKTAVTVALIGAAATLLAAIAGGLFGFFSSSDNNSASGKQPEPLTRPELFIRTVSLAQGRGEIAVTVTGVARDIPAGASVYVIVKPD